MNEVRRARPLPMIYLPEGLTLVSQIAAVNQKQHVPTLSEREIAEKRSRMRFVERSISAVAAKQHLETLPVGSYVYTDATQHINDLDYFVFFHQDQLTPLAMQEFAHGLGVPAARMPFTKTDRNDIASSAIQALGYSFQMQGIAVNMEVSTLEYLLESTSLTTYVSRTNRKRLENMSPKTPCFVKDITGETVEIREPYFHMEWKGEVVDITVPGILSLPDRGSITIPYIWDECLSGYMQKKTQEPQAPVVKTLDQLLRNVTFLLVEHHGLTDVNGYPTKAAYNEGLLRSLFMKQDDFSDAYSCLLRERYVAALQELGANMERRRRG